MAPILAYRLESGKPGFFDLAAGIRYQIYRYLLIDQEHNTIPILQTRRCHSKQDQLAISARSLSAQLLRTCHGVLNEAYPILYAENNFVLSMDNRMARTCSIPISLTRGNIPMLEWICMSIQSVRLLEGDLQFLLPLLPYLQILSINGNLLRTIDFYRHSQPESDVALQRCIDQSFGLLLSAFGGKELFRRFMVHNPNLVVEYNFGVAVDLILPATGNVVKGAPQWYTADMRPEMEERHPLMQPDERKTDVFSKIRSW